MRRENGAKAKNTCKWGRPGPSVAGRPGAWLGLSRRRSLTTRSRLEQLPVGSIEAGGRMPPLV